jgi:lipoyl(octanoyl) transferase
VTSPPRAARHPDELWLVEHTDPVFTQGLAGRPEHVLGAGDIPVVQTQRGGQVTYHGPGQVVAYPLVDLQRLGIYVKEYVFRLEEAVLRTLAEVGVTGHRVRSAPGIYVRLADPFDHAVLPVVGPGPTRSSAWARSPRWASRSRGTARTTAWR